MKVFALSIHADYRCQHSGACCAADWDVPVELPVYRGLAEALHGHRLHPASEVGDGPFITEPGLPDEAAAMLARTETGECVFFHRDTHLCVVHRDLGESALPETCRHFPRLALRDARGTFITLSHFCPTAASMLFREGVPLEIVEAPPAFPLADYGGLAVPADAWPPLLHSRLLMDLEGYSAWERHMVRRCAADCTPDAVVATLHRDARALCQWTPSSGTLVEAVNSLPRSTVGIEPPREFDQNLRLYEEVGTAIPDDLKPPADEHGLDSAYRDHVRAAWCEFGTPINRFLATKAFASWTAYQGRGIRAIVRGLEAALALVRVEAARLCRDRARRLDRDTMLEAFRAADFVLNHLAIAEDLAARWSRPSDVERRNDRSMIARAEFSLDDA